MNFQKKCKRYLIPLFFILLNMKDNIFDNPRTYTLSSLILGYLLIGDLSAYEQNALGNWLMTIAQILEANSAIQQLFESNIQEGNININSKEAKNNKEAYIKKIKEQVAKNKEIFE